MIKKILLAMQFLTIIPVKITGDVSEQEIAGSAAFFPIVGAVQGIACVVSAALLSKIFPVEITCCLVLVMLIITNGGFHLDGLADTFDALAVKSSGDGKADRARRLSAMKDSTTGSIGVTAIVVAVLLKYLLMKNIFLYSSSIPLYSLLFLMPVCSQWILVPAMFHGVSAREDGLGKIFVHAVRRKEIVLATLITALPCLAVAELLQDTAYAPFAGLLFLLLFVVLYSSCLIWVGFFRERFGGLTGDTFGAMHEISEILYLMVGVLWLQHSI